MNFNPCLRLKHFSKPSKSKLRRSIYAVAIHAKQSSLWRRQNYSTIWTGFHTWKNCSGYQATTHEIYVHQPLHQKKAVVVCYIRTIIDSRIKINPTYISLIGISSNFEAIAKPAQFISTSIGPRASWACKQNKELDKRFHSGLYNNNNNKFLTTESYLLNSVFDTVIISGNVNRENVNFLKV